ncbi:NADH dehydrogenase [Pelagirhabdus alkalitolerans]|uniref:NADH dehydrogenase n=1 Tax=Pelagirhabdus alkalitolerans TaxID=1612202 RepID=A0A1G6LTK6_9BACI|nr:NAD(P)/FAD-dependent oxidoreductase [Pelagirhabdus alkalitolerans]SDC46580.1 NADH dehydrogenase [Pelagirhabdus alkalitolerans]
MNPKKIVIVGAGYAGLTALNYLSKKLKGKDVSIYLVNKHHYHYQTIWLHRNATGVYDESYSRFDLNEIIKDPHVHLLKDTVTKVRPELKLVETTNTSIEYDYLVMALGSEIDPMEIPGLKEHAYSITTLSRANQLYNRLQTLMSDYSQSSQKHPLHIVVGGGGFTGVELLGELTEQLPILANEYDVKESQIRLTTIESEPTVLPEFDLELGEYAMQHLEERGVEFKLKTKIRSIETNSIKIEQLGFVESLPLSLFIWTAGVKGHHVIEDSSLPSTDGRIHVNSDMTVPGFPSIYCIGDIAIVKDEKGIAQLPNAELAIQEAKVAAKNIMHQLGKHKHGATFSLEKRGTIASIGAKNAIGVMGRKNKVIGIPASLLKKWSDCCFLYRIGGIRLLWSMIKKKRHV